MPALRPDTSIKFLKGIGERRAEAFARLGVRTAQDLLWHIPYRYLDASTVTPLVRAQRPMPHAELELFLLWKAGKGAARLAAAPWGYERDDCWDVRTPGVR